MKKRISFQLIYLIICLFVFGLLSCGRASNIPKHLDDDFLFGTAEGLYRIRDLQMILDPKAAKLRKDSKSEKQPEYEAILSSKENLYEATDLQVNIFSLEELLKIQTVKRGQKVKISSGMENVFIDPEIPFLNEYELLDYTIARTKTDRQKTLEKLLGQIRKFRGFPKTDYYILPHFMGNYLILYKLGPPDKIPYNELPLAKRVGDMLAVPLVSYPVEYCQAVKVLKNDKEILKSRSLCKGVQQEKPVKYVRLWEHSKRVFEYLPKLDFFQRDFFEGQWLFFRTDIRLPVRHSDNIRHTPFNSARLVKFHPALGKIDVVEGHNLNQDDEKRVLFIPVKWTDYEVARDSETLHPSFSERLKEDIHEINRPYLEVKFNELIRNEFEYSEKGGKSLKSVIIMKDYISFDIEITTKGREAYLMKYAFKRYVENPDYMEKQWFKKDHLLFFPVFEVKRKYYEDPADHTLADETRFSRTVRFDPKSKEILWYFSTHTPHIKWIRNLGHEAVDLLNKALQKAGRNSNHKIKLVLDETGADKEVGDIRYNILNLILSESEEPEQFRWGSNIANPITGEVVSTTANVWMNKDILNKYINIVRKYIRFNIYPPAWQMKPFSPDVVTFIHNNVETNNLQCGDLSHEPQSVTPFLHEKIQSVCPEVSDFIKQHQKEVFHPRHSRLWDKVVVKSCVHKLARVKILQFILHGMLHSLGLEDILSASVDSENFYENGEMEELFENSISEVTTDSHPHPPQYSSVMDVMNLEYPILSVPGKLDIAALRFIYFDKVEKADGGFLHVPSGADRDPNNPQKSILEIASIENYTKENLKDYKICGWDKDHPLLCQKGDYGISPLEVISNAICKEHNHLISERNRYDGNFVRSTGYQLKRIASMYNKWKDYRDDILAARGESILDYSFLNSKHIKEYNQIMETAKANPDIKPYYDIRRPIFDYLKRAGFAPTKHCVYKKVSDVNREIRYSAMALENIEEKLFRQYPENSEKANEVFMSCESQIVKDWAKENNKGTLVTEVGFFLKNRRYFIRPNEKVDPIDERSAFQHTLNLFVVDLSSVLQEPEFGAEYYREWLAYIFQGIDLNPYIDRDALKDPDIPHDIQLNRVLSYKVDTMAPSKGALKNLWFVRGQSVRDYRRQLQDYSNTESLRLFPLYFSYQTFSLTDLRDYANSTQAHPGLHDREILFLTQAYQEYKNGTVNQQGEIPFAKFIQTHPAALFIPDSSLFLLPYIDEETNFMARLFRQYNEFLQHIEEYETKGEFCNEEYKNNSEFCNEIEEKRVFIKLLLNTYKDASSEDNLVDFDVLWK